jgi:two-component system, NarL family, nitrate/nitrite response regulator NarL
VHSRIRVGIVADHPLFREGLTRALGATAHLAVVAEGGTADDALAMASDAAPDILLLEIEIPGNGIVAARAISQTKCRTKVVILTASDEEELVIDALRAGAQGYILKDVTGADLIGAIESVHRGAPYITPTLASRLISHLATRHGTLLANRDFAGLSPRERQVLSHLSEGLTSREMASRLGVSVKTIKQHKTLLFSKMGVRNRVEAAARLRHSDAAHGVGTSALRSPARARASGA